MRSTIVVVAALMVVGLGTAVFGDTGRTLAGQYIWSVGGAEGPVTAHFEPVDANNWTVDFDFRFDGKDHRYSGTAQGSLDSGQLEGTVTTENGKRRFSFRGNVADGNFRGVHADVTRGDSGEATGTLTLSAK